MIFKFPARLGFIPMHREIIKLATYLVTMLTFGPWNQSAIGGGYASESATGCDSSSAGSVSYNKKAT